MKSKLVLLLVKFFTGHTTELSVNIIGGPLTIFKVLNLI